MPNSSEITLDLELKVTRDEDRWHLESGGKSFGNPGGYEDLKGLKAMAMGIVMDDLTKYFSRLEAEEHQWILLKARQAKSQRNAEVFGGHSDGDSPVINDHMAPFKGTKEAPRKVTRGRKPKGKKNE